MAIYDHSANPATAVTAFLSQFKIFSNGNIRYVAGTDTFHVWWLHRALQKIAWDFNVSGDDEINLSKPNPSTSEALGTIITLLDHTVDFATQYNIDDIVATYLFGGSVSQKSGTELYSGLRVLGSVNNPSTQLQIIQNDTLLTSHWGTGKNQTDASTLLRILVKTTVAGADIDGKRIIVKASEWGDTYAVWRTTMGLGESVAAINTVADPQNNTPLATVQTYTGISNVEGYQTIDVGNGSGPLPYLAQWSYGANSKKALYEWVKSLMVRGTTSSIYGISGELFTGGATFETDITLGNGGTWVQNEVVSWTEGGVASTGILMATDNMTAASTTLMWIHILTGINPTSGTVISGATASASVNTTVTPLTSSPHHLGVFTGSSWIGAFGVGFNPAQLSAADSVIDLNGTTVSPPNNVPISVSTNGAIDPHIMLARRSGNSILYNEYTIATGNIVGNTTLVINEPIKSDTSQTGFVMVKEGTAFEPIEYTSWSGSTFTLLNPLAKAYTATRNAFVPFLYESATGTVDPRNVTKSIIYNADVPVIGWVRHGDPVSPDKPVNISGTIGTAGLSLTVQLDNET